VLFTRKKATTVLQSPAFRRKGTELEELYPEVDHYLAELREKKKHCPGCWKISKPLFNKVANQILLSADLCEKVKTHLRCDRLEMVIFETGARKQTVV